MIWRTDGTGMKKNGIVMVLILLLSMSWAASAQAERVVGKISKIKGSVDVFRNNSPQAIKATLGMDLLQQDKVVTRAKAYVRFKMIDNSIMTLGEKGELHLDEFQYKPQEKQRVALFSVVVGKLRVFANEMLKFRDNRFNIKTPTAVAGVRGTLFMVWVESNAMTHVACLDRAVEVKSNAFPDQPVVLTKNIYTHVAGKTRPSPPVLMTTEQFNMFQQGFVDDIRAGKEEKAQKPVGAEDAKDVSPIPVNEPNKETFVEPEQPGSRKTETGTDTTVVSTTPTTMTTSFSTTTTTSSPPTTTTTTSPPTTTTTTTSPPTTTSTTTTTTTTLPPMLPAPPGLPQ